MKDQNDLLTLQVGTGIAALATSAFTIISALFMIVSIATGCIHIYEYIKKKRKGL
jgi:uncharacterized membrane protein